MAQKKKKTKKDGGFVNETLYWKEKNGKNISHQLFSEISAFGSRHDLIGSKMQKTPHEEDDVQTQTSQMNKKLNNAENTSPKHREIYKIRFYFF